MRKRRVAWKWWKVDAAGIAACVALTAGLILFGIRPRMARYQEALARRDVMDEQSRKAAEVQKAFSVCQSELQAVGKELDSSSMRLQPAAGINRKLAEMSELAGECGLKVNEIHPGGPVARTHYQVVPIHLAGAGPYRSFTTFIHRLHQSSTDLGISTIELTGNPADVSGAGAFRLQLQWFAAPGADTAMK